MSEKPRQMTHRHRQDHWAVMVYRDGENIVTIETNHLAGRDLSQEDEAIIRLCARHLLAFIGESLA